MQKNNNKKPIQNNLDWFFDGNKACLDKKYIKW